MELIKWFDKETDEDVTEVLVKLKDELKFAQKDDKPTINKNITEFERKYCKCRDFENKCLIFLEI